VLVTEELAIGIGVAVLLGACTSHATRKTTIRITALAIVDKLINLLMAFLCLTSETIK
jgi:hypothetical protein